MDNILIESITHGLVLVLTNINESFNICIRSFSISVSIYWKHFKLLNEHKENKEISNKFRHL